MNAKRRATVGLLAAVVSAASVSDTRAVSTWEDAITSAHESNRRILVYVYDGV